MARDDDLPVRALRLRGARADAGLTLEELGAATGIHRSSLSAYENGRRISTEHGILLEEFFNVPEGTFFTRPVLPCRSSHEG